MKPGAEKEIKAHKWPRHPEDWYVEPHWISQRLFEAEAFSNGHIHDPCAGSGRIPLAAQASGLKATGSDIRNRGFGLTETKPFLESTTRAANFVMNPPFGTRQDRMLERFCAHAVGLTEPHGKVCAVSPARRVIAASSWMPQLGLRRVWYLGPRPSMPPGDILAEMTANGEEPESGKEDFCWLVFVNGYSGPWQGGWLHRDKGIIR